MTPMHASASIDGRRVVGRSPESLTVEEWFALAGKYAAFEIYTPQTTPLRVIEALGDSAEECIRALQARGLNPAKFEFVRLSPPF